MNRTLDIEKIISTNIPDIAAVYGGVRGRTMSSRHQNYAWPIICEAGIRTIIDLREDNPQSKMQEKCKLYDMNYFHYPVDTECKSLESMVDLLPDLCYHIDKGNFYIACAMGLHRTDIALCTYWVFHAAEKGIEPPQIKGYNATSGHNTSKIMRILNGIYSFISERTGQEPMSMQEFKRRKNIINSMSKEG